MRTCGTSRHIGSRPPAAEERPSDECGDRQHGHCGEQPSPARPGGRFVPTFGITAAGLLMAINLFLFLFFLDRFVHRLRPVARRRPRRGRRPSSVRGGRSRWKRPDAPDILPGPFENAEQPTLAFAAPGPVRYRRWTARGGPDSRASTLARSSSTTDRRFRTDRRKDLVEKAETPARLVVIDADAISQTDTDGRSPHQARRGA